MKKSVLFLIGVICFISVFVVTFFGADANIDQFKVYITKVEITNYDRIYDSYGKYKKVTFDELEGASIFIEYTIGPENATDKSAIKFSVVQGVGGDEDSPIAVIDQKGELSFLKKGTVTVYITPTDGWNCSDSMTVKCL